MAVSFPTSLPTYPDTGSGEVLGTAGGGIGLSRILDDYGLDITGLATKIGTGADTPLVNEVFTGTGTGTSGWTATLAGLTLTAPVLSGSLTGTYTLAGTPTITAPAISAPVLSSTATGTYTLGGTVTITTPTIASFTNATHDHSNAAGGGVLTHTGLPVGVVVQVVQTDYSADTSGNTILPLDNTIPQITEGFEVMSQAITPKSTTNILLIEYTVMASSAGTNALSAAIFRDSTTAALHANTQWQVQSAGDNSFSGSVKATAGSISATTFKVRIGPDTTQTVTFGGGRFDTIPHSYIRITEVKA